MSACIIPVAPDFQDPPSVPDTGPFLSGFSPRSFGELVTVPVPSGQLFSANVIDQDVSATLYVRWAVDYPPLIDGVTYSVLGPSIQPSSNGQTVNQITTPTPVDCSWIKQTLTSSHKLELIVADRSFADSSTVGPADKKLDTTTDPNGRIAYGLWPIDISCPASDTSNGGSP